MKHYSIVAIEVSNEGKSPELKHFTMGGEDLCPQSHVEIANMALSAIKDTPGAKEVKFVADISEEDFNKYFHNQLLDYILTKN